MGEVSPLALAEEEQRLEVGGQVSWKTDAVLPFMAIIAITGYAMRSVNVAELKNRLSTYLTYAKSGEVVVIRDRNLPVAKLIPFTAEDASEEELALVAAGAMRLPEKPLDLDQLWKMPRATVRGNAAVRAVLDERDEGR
jgi:prevent-host-death family protein